MILLWHKSVIAWLLIAHAYKTSFDLKVFFYIEIFLNNALIYIVLSAAISSAVNQMSLIIITAEQPSCKSMSCKQTRRRNKAKGGWSCHFRTFWEGAVFVSITRVNKDYRNRTAWGQGTRIAKQYVILIFLNRQTSQPTIHRQLIFNLYK